jgi:hypothetical protein
MGKVGQLVQEAQQFAQDHYNMDREEFYRHASAYAWKYSMQMILLTGKRFRLI